MIACFLRTILYRTGFLSLILIALGTRIGFAVHTEPENKCPDPALTCEQVVAVMDLDWPPYAIQLEKSPPGGLAVDLAELIFKELDIPLKIIAHPDDYQLYHGLLTGKIDIVLSTYDYPGSEELFGCLVTDYISDPIQVLQKKSDPQVLNRWLDLQGRQGLLTRYQKLDRRFESQIGSVLYLSQASEKIDFHNWVTHFADNQTGQYLVGSELQWRYLLQQRDFQFLPVKTSEALKFKAPVYMAFSIHSKCHRYVAYLTQRLAELKSDGTIDRLLSRYIRDISGKPPSKNDDLPSSEHDKLNYH